VHAAGIVANHPAERAAVVSGRIGREGQMMLFGFGAEVIQDYPWLNPGDAALGIDFEDARHVLREIEHDRYIAALTRERSACATGQQRGAMFAAENNRGENVFRVTRDDDPDGDLTVVRTVGRVEGTAAGVKSDFSAKVAPQSGFKSRSVNGLRAGSQGAH